MLQFPSQQFFTVRYSQSAREKLCFYEPQNWTKPEYGNKNLVVETLFHMLRQLNLENFSNVIANMLANS